MITGIGTDLVAIERVKRLWERHPHRLQNDLLTSNEYNTFRAILGDDTIPESCQSDRATRFVASRLAAKEAAVKVIGAPHKTAYNWCDLEITGDKQINIHLDKRLKQLAKGKGCLRLVGSVHDNGRYCLAIVIGET